jgi:hypothetical protein
VSRRKKVGNTTPPSVALLAYAAAQIGLLAAVLIPLIAGLVRLHRPLLRVLPTGLAPARPVSRARIRSRSG